MNNPKHANDLLLTGGRVFGGTQWNQPQWNEAVFVKQGHIVAVGGSDDLRRALGDVREIDLSGNLLLPGLGDAHIHMMLGGKSFGMLDLGGMSLDQIRQELRQVALSASDIKDQWVIAFNWDRSYCPFDASILDEIVPDVEVIVYGKDLHCCCCNTKALETAGITTMNFDPVGGVIECDERQRPTGMLYEAAVGMMDKFVSKPSAGILRLNILDAQEHLLSLGLTAVSEVLEIGAEKLFRQLDHEGELILEVDGWRRIEQWDGQSVPPLDGNRFRVRTLKIFLDGSFGSNTAALNDPYQDAPDKDGILFYTDNELEERLLPAVQAGWRLAMHAIGDKAVAQACRVLQRLPHVEFSGSHRIEHAQLLPDNGVDLFLQSRAIASIQPIHLLDDQRWLRDRLGVDRIRRSFVWRSLIDSGVTLAMGTDWPVASSDPLLNIHTAINRCGFGDEPNPDFDITEAILPHTAIRVATFGWATAAGVSDRRGVIEPEYSADFTVVSGVSDDLRDWSRAQVVMTICRGKVVFQKQEI
ncbi:MAG: amidohydrolase family protein [Candidatus Electryoneaceae bacterium]|nr:amidohydrolase family protein [Candidatus Electryoneaceae bacterium]